MYDIEVGVVGCGGVFSLMVPYEVREDDQSAILGEVEEGRGRVCGREIGAGGGDVSVWVWSKRGGRVGIFGWSACS